MEEEKEIIKTIQEVSKLGTKALETGEKLGDFLSRVFGTLPEDIAGIAGKDYIKHVRIRNISKLQQRTDAILEERGFNKDYAPLSMNIALPLLEAAQNESREELQELWAKMLANAMDPNRSSVVRQSIIEVVQNFEPLDAKLLETASESLDKSGNVHVLDLPEELGVNLNEFELSINKLVNLKCVIYSDNNRKIGVGKTADIVFTHLGYEILRACRP
jgi:hypothetical protein